MAYVVPQYDYILGSFIFHTSDWYFWIVLPMIMTLHQTDVILNNWNQILMDLASKLHYSYCLKICACSWFIKIQYGQDFPWHLHFNWQIAQALKPVVRRAGFWGSVKTLARGYEIVMGLLLFTPVAFLAWFPFVSEFQTRMLFNQAFSRGLQISRILGGQRKERSSRNKE